MDLSNTKVNIKQIKWNLSIRIPKVYRLIIKFKNMENSNSKLLFLFICSIAGNFKRKMNDKEMEEDEDDNDE